MPNTYLPAPEVAAMAAQIIAEAHPHLSGVRIDYVWRTEPVRRRDRTDIGKAVKLSGLSAFLAREEVDDTVLELTPVAKPDAFFVIQIWQVGWGALKEPQRLRVLDSLLCTFAAEEVADEASGRVRLSLSLKAPEVVEFREVYERHPRTPSDEIEAAITRTLMEAQEERKAAKRLARPASEVNAVIGANGKPRRKKREKRDYGDAKPGVSKEQRVVGDSVFTLAVTPDGSEFQFMIARSYADGQECICVAGRRAESVAAAKQFFEEYISEHEVGVGA